MQSFRPPALIGNAHLQTVLASSAVRRRRVLREAAPMLASSRDELADCGDGVRLLLHHVPPPDFGGGRVAVLIHGWEGSGQSTYMLIAAARLWAAGFRVIRLNLRDHGDSHHLNAELFHSCRLDEAVGAVRWVQEQFPDERLLLGGYSLGGNFALRIAAAADSAGLRLEGVGAVCPVLDPVATMHALDHGWFIYRRYFLAKWRTSLERKRRAFPERYDFGDLGRFRTLESMTEFFVREYTPFPDLLTYLRGYALTGDRLSNLRVPVHALFADDDPVIPIDSLSAVEIPASMHVERSPRGGHCGFIQDPRMSSRLDDYLPEVFAGYSR